MALHSTSGKLAHHAAYHQCLTAAPRAPSPAPPAMDLLGLDDLLGGTSLTSAPVAQSQQPPPPPPLQLRPQPQLSPQVFQQKWGSLTNIAKFQHSLSPSAMAFIEANKHQVGVVEKACASLCAVWFDTAQVVISKCPVLGHNDLVAVCTTQYPQSCSPSAWVVLDDCLPIAIIFVTQIACFHVN